MRQETRDKLNQLQRGDRRSLIFALALGVLVAGGLSLASEVTYGDRVPVNAVVRMAYTDHSPETGVKFMRIQAELANGQIVLAGEGPGVSQAPSAGSEVVLVKRMNWLGRVTYRWNGELQP